MKIYIPRQDEGEVGGGWTFTRNLKKTLKDSVEFVNTIEECDIFFIPGSTLTTIDKTREARRQGKKIVLRIDGILKNSRNIEPRGIPHFEAVLTLADEIVYQSEYVRGFMIPYTKRDGVVILNGGDNDVFKPEGVKQERQGKPQYLYSRYRTEEMKRWEKAWYDFQIVYFNNHDSHLWITGQFKRELKLIGFDFFGGAEHNFKYFGGVTDREKMAMLYRGADIVLLPYFQDPCSNVAIEARLCGTEIIWDEKEGGGTREIMECHIEYLYLDRMGKEYLNLFKSLC